MRQCVVRDRDESARGTLRGFDTFLYQFRPTIDAARSNASLTPDQRLTYRQRCAEFLTPAFDALYKKFIQTSSISSTNMDASAFRPCLLRVHSLDRRYDLGRATEIRAAAQEG